MMEEIYLIKFSWWQLMMTGIGLLAGYFLLQLLSRWLSLGLLSGISLGSNTRFNLQKALKWMVAVYEPAATLILFGIFVFINPVLHGILALLVFIAGYSHVKNYIDGRFVFANTAISPGIKMRSGEIQGVVTRKSRSGIYLRSRTGLHFINYSNLFREGFIILAGEEVGKFCQLQVVPEADISSKEAAKNLENLLATTPYVDWSQSPRLRTYPDSDTIDVRVLLRDDSHVKELMQLIREWGYKCRKKEKTEYSS